MRKIFSVLKRYWFSILVVVCLLVAQAQCDLKLPEYTSNIVNIGIQQEGIENTTLDVISKSSLEKLMIFLNEQDSAYVKSNYMEISKQTVSEKKLEDYEKKYNLIKAETLYQLKKIDDKEKEHLEKMLEIPMIMVYMIEKEPAKFAGQLKLNVTEVNQIFEIFSKMEKKKLTEQFSSMSQQYDKLDDSIISQMAINFVKMEKEHLGVDLQKLQISYIVRVGIQMFALSLIIMILMITTTFLASKIAAAFSRDLRSQTVNKIMAYSNREFDEFGAASLLTRSTNDIQQIQMLVIMVLRILIYAPILGFGALAKVQGNSMSWIIALAVLTILSLVIILLVIAMPKFQKLQKLIDKLNLVSREILIGLPVIRAFSNEKYEEKRFDKANNDLMKTNLFVNRVMTVMMPTMMFIMNGVSILIIWVAADKIDMGTIQVGDMMAFITYTMQIIMSFLMISMVSIMLPRAFVSVKRIGELLNKKISVFEKEKTERFDSSKKGIVEFKGVYFRYPDAEEDVLQDITFTANPGTTTAFIGSTGSGKSTLINLIPRFFDVTGGKIVVDGVDIRNAKIKELRKKIGYVPQKGILFSGTIKSNIAFGEERLSQEKVEIAAKISQSKEFIEKKEEKYNSEISQGGTNVSGGQKQRLSIARAIAKNPEIYIFDDSFSALDYKTDAKLRKELAKTTKDSTIFIVAQRISTILHADQIIVLDQGKIVGIGKHEDLLKNCNVYKEIALSQLGEEELENGK